MFSVRYAIALVMVCLQLSLNCATAMSSAESEGKQIIEYCKGLFADVRLDPLRLKTAFNAQDLTTEHFMQDVVPTEAEVALFPIVSAYSSQCKRLTVDFLNRYVPSTLPAYEWVTFRYALVWAELSKRQMTWTNANLLIKQAWLEAYQSASNTIVAEEERARQRWAQAARALDDAAQSLGPNAPPQPRTTWCRWVGNTFACSQF